MACRVRAFAAAAAVALIAVVAAAPASAAPNNNTVRKLTDAVTPAGVLNHLEALQGVADANGGNRAAGRSGYAASVGYVVDRLNAAGYSPVVQSFPFQYAEENSELIRVSPVPRTFVNGTDFIRNRFDSGVPEGTATGALRNIDLVLNPSGPANTSNSGCEAADFAGFPAGAVALVQRGTCGFNVKVLNAQAAGASAVIVMNEGQPGRTGLVGMIGDATGLHIPAVFATFAAGLDLATTPSSTVTVKVDFTAEQRTAFNVLAETAGGNPDNVVMAGAHLDSVQPGAGINDNGSGSAAVLETAIQMAKVKPANKVRFAWWGAEESGLLGSTFYVSQLSEEEADDIALYLNFDMIASPNYTFGIYDGDNSGGTAVPGFIPPGSAEIEDQFERFFTARGEPFTDTAFDGRSDYGPFIAIGIPAGGLFTGAEVPKTVAEAAVWGGVAGAQLDPCYHAFCDNLRGDGHNVALFNQLAQDYELVGNVNVGALDVNSDAIAATILTFANDTSSVNAVAGKPGRSNGLFKFGETR
jgi:Zn-dependent M28 family amino/carboxypeptidase